MFDKVSKKIGKKFSYKHGRADGNKVWGRILVCALLTVLAVILANDKPETAGVFMASAGSKNRKLPIYSVETGEKKVALSFDAAWAAV